MMTSNDTVTVLLCGVGGQGTILAADLLAHAALESGYDAKVSEPLFKGGLLMNGRPCN